MCHAAVNGEINIVLQVLRNEYDGEKSRKLLHSTVIAEWNDVERIKSITSREFLIRR